MKSIIKLLSFLALIAFNPFSLFCQTSISVIKVASNLSIPVDIAFDHNDEMYVVEKKGIIQWVDRSKNPAVNSEFLNISSIVNSEDNERGLLGLAFHPNYKINGYFYVNYTNLNGTTIIARYSRSGQDSMKANSNSAKLIMSIPQPYPNHNGGDLNFDEHGYLFIGMGDGGSGGDPGNRSQNPRDKQGKMLRINIDTENAPYGIPSDNPFVGNQDTLPEIWALGMRNPWRFSFDALNYDLWIADVGQNKWEEIDFEPGYSPGGLNYGWRCYEGNVTYNYTNCDESRNYIKPVKTYVTSSSGDGCSVTGGFVYRGSEIPLLYGNYIYGDYCSGNIWKLVRNDCDNFRSEKIFKIGSTQLSTFGQDRNGEIYYAEIGNGNIFKIQQKCKKHVFAVNVKDALCETGFGSVSFDIGQSENFTIKVNEQLLDLTQLMPGAYKYKFTDLSSSCTEEGCFNIPLKNFTEFSSNLPGSFFRCKEDSFLIKLDYFDPRPDSIIYVFGPPGQAVVQKTIVDSFYIKSVDGLNTAYVNGCALPFYLPIDLKFYNDNTHPVVDEFTNTFLKLKGDFIGFRIMLGNDIIAENTTGIFNITLAPGTYVILGLYEHGCTSYPLELSIVSATNEQNTNVLSVYPNPANDVLNIEVDQFIFAKIYDKMGKVVLTSDSKQVEIKDLISGQYQIMVMTKDKSYGSAFVVVRE